MTALIRGGRVLDPASGTDAVLDVRIDGFGRVEYLGNPRVHQRIDGSGRVVRAADGE